MCFIVFELHEWDRASASRNDRAKTASVGPHEQSEMRETPDVALLIRANQAAEIKPLAASLNLAAEESKAAPPSLRSPPQSSAIAPRPAVPRGLPMDDDFARVYREGKATEKRERLEGRLNSMSPEELWSNLRGAADRQGQCHDWAANRFKDLRGKYPDRAWNSQTAAKRPDPDVLDWLTILRKAYAKSQGGDEIEF
jgi:hypothetical protein